MLKEFPICTSSIFIIIGHRSLEINVTNAFIEIQLPDETNNLFNDLINILYDVDSYFQNR